MVLSCKLVERRALTGDTLKEGLHRVTVDLLVAVTGSGDTGVGIRHGLQSLKKTTTKTTEVL